MPLSELRHETGTQKSSMTTVSANALVMTSNACIFASIGAATSRNSRTLDNPTTSAAAATTAASTVNATRRKVLLNSGPPGRYANAEANAPTVAAAIKPFSLLIILAAGTL